MRETNQELMRLTLSAAVPMWIARLQGIPWDRVQKRAGECGQIVAEKGDVIQFKGKGTADAFNALAEGIACLAFAQGGVTFMDLHFHALHPDVPGSEDALDSCARCAR